MSVTLMRGRIGSGKTYYARELCKQTGAQLLSIDEFTQALFGTACPGRETLVKAEAAALSFFLKLAAENEKQGRDTVIDHGFWLLAELKRAQDFLENNCIKYSIVELTADFETRLARVANRQNGKSFDKEKLLRLDGFYQTKEK